MLPFALWLAACGPGPDAEPIPEPLLEDEIEAWAAYEASTVSVSGRVLDAAGTPLVGASVSVDATSTTTDDTGHYTLGGLLRRNAIWRVEAAGYRTHLAAAELSVPVDQVAVGLADVHLDAVVPGTTRFLFAGDMALGRRYLDPEDDTPRGVLPPLDPMATIRLDRVEEDSVDVVAGMIDWFEVADVRAVNLETPVTDAPTTPHLTKEWAFFTLPGSLASLEALGVAFVSLGNNHVYDYLEAGVTDTLNHLREAELGFAGAGRNADEAFVPWRFSSSDTDYTFVSATSIAGVGRATPLFTADDTKGGAADLRDTQRLVATIGGEVDAGRTPIALVHMGVEYSRTPNEYAIDRAQTAVDAGAAFVIGHHPHTTQGFSLLDERLVAWSLGNFAFDQDRLETFAGYTLTVDAAGDTTGPVHVLPHVIDEYRPVLATGSLAERVLRDAGTHSTPELTVQLDGGHGRVVAPVPTPFRSVEVQVPIDEHGMGYLDLRPELGANESVVGAELVRGASRWWLGRDHLLFGDFEDHDVDSDLLEAAAWFRGASSRVCLTGAHAGTAGLCLYRTERSRDPASVAFRFRVRVPGDAENEPLKDLTLLGWIRGDNAGPSEVYARQYASFGDKEFGKQDLVIVEGTFDWTSFAVPLDLPPDQADAVDPWADNARAVRIFVNQFPPYAGAGRLTVDDLAVVAWEFGPYDAPDPRVVRAPNSAAFLRVEGAPGTTASVTLRVATVPGA